MKPSAAEGPTYTDLAHRCHLLEADNAALLGEFRSVIAVLWGPDVDRRPAEISAQLVLAQPHPGAALLDKMEEFQKQVAGHDAALQQAWKTGMETGASADRRAVDRMRAERDEHMMLAHEARSQAEALKAGQRSASEARQQAFLELAQEMADMTPEQMAIHVRAVIEHHDGGGR